MFGKAKVELTEEQKEQAKNEKEMAAIRLKEKLKKIGKGAALVAAGALAGYGTAKLQDHLNKDEDEFDNIENDMDNEEDNVFTEETNEVA